MPSDDVPAALLGFAPDGTTPLFGALGAPYTGPIYGGGPGMCALVQSNDCMASTVGPQLAPSSFPAVVHDLSGSAGRVISNTMMTTTGAALYVDGLYDTAIGTACAAAIAQDGVLRCLPIVPATGVDYFADPACSVPALAQNTPPPPLMRLNDDQSRLWLVDFGDTPSTLETAFHFYYQGDGTFACVSTAYAGSSFYIGTVLAPASFSPVTDMVE